MIAKTNLAVNKFNATKHSFRCNFPYCRTVLSATGATVVETVIFLPILLILVFFCYWLGVMSNTKAAFEVAVKHALYLAVTRSDPLNVNLADAATGGLPSGVIGDVTAWHTNGAGTPPPPSQLLPLLLSDGSASPNYGALWADPNYGQLYTATNGTLSVIRNVNAGSSLHLLPTSYTYALIYLYQTMRQAIGNTVRYPCDPNNPSNGSGCLLCHFTDPTGAVGSFTAPANEGGHIGLSCSFTPDTLIGNALRALFGLVSGSTSTTPFVTMTQTALVRSGNGFILQ